MPELGKEITKKINFPQYPKDDPAWVVVICNPPKEVYLDIPTDAGDKDSYWLVKIIKDWNFTTNGVKSPINLENVAKLSMVERALIMSELGLMDLLSDAKKNS